jgi:hypothetical protein
MQRLIRFAKVDIRNPAKEILKTEDAPTNFENLKTSNCSIHWIKTQLKQ